MMAFIYGIFDPRKPIENEYCRYIGQTVQILTNHLNNHISTAKTGGTSIRDEWIRSVLADGVRPVIHLLEEVDDILATDAECRWINHGFAQGWDLTNEGTGRVPIPWDSSPHLTPQKIEAFWSKVAILGDDDCWEWLAYRNDDGYGMFGIGSRTDNSRRRLYAHRLSWELANGPIPNRLIVCHACDNPSCVNPAHLFLDSFSGNMRDASSKGRVRNQFSDLDEVTHCPRGHEYSLTSKGKKYCKICNRENTAKWRQEQRDAAGLPPAKQYGQLTHCPRGHEYNEENTFYNTGSTTPHCRICHRDNSRRSRERKRAAESSD